MRKKLTAFGFAAAIGAATLALAPASSEAQSPYGQWQGQQGQWQQNQQQWPQGQWQQAPRQQQGWSGPQTWSGPRYSSPRPGYNNFHGGFWYATPGFSIQIGPKPRPSYGYGMPIAHVEWCLNRYRSYNPQTNLYFSRPGVQKQCRSPVWG